MSKITELRKALFILEHELRDSDLVIHLLRETITCCKCINSSCEINKKEKPIWVCKLFGEIPEEYTKAACDNWSEKNLPELPQRK